jgi:hypothetical protein|tara:strand:+ start:654 stop:914 length:261 start_codon:yes stop_codon:yes gene_type:complete
VENLKILVLVDGTMILSQIDEVSSELGDPDCKLTEPFIINPSTMEFSPWFVDFTSQNIFMIQSDKILTIIDPNTKNIKKYEALLKG